MVRNKSKTNNSSKFLCSCWWWSICEWWSAQSGATLRTAVGMSFNCIPQDIPFIAVLHTTPSFPLRLICLLPSAKCNWASSWTVSSRPLCPRCCLLSASFFCDKYDSLKIVFDSASPPSKQPTMTATTSRRERHAHAIRRTCATIHGAPPVCSAVQQI